MSGIQRSYELYCNGSFRPKVSLVPPTITPVAFIESESMFVTKRIVFGSLLALTLCGCGLPETRPEAPPPEAAAPSSSEVDRALEAASTLSFEELSGVPGISSELATKLVEARLGVDGLIDTEDDVAFTELSELSAVGVGTDLLNALGSFVQAPSTPEAVLPVGATPTQGFLDCDAMDAKQRKFADSHGYCMAQSGADDVQGDFGTASSPLTIETRPCGHAWLDVQERLGKGKAKVLFGYNSHVGNIRRVRAIMNWYNFDTKAGAHLDWTSKKVGSPAYATVRRVKSYGPGKLCSTVRGHARIWWGAACIYAVGADCQQIK